LDFEKGQTTMTLDEIMKKRFTAGLEYTRATVELHDALVELAALDAVLESESSGHHDRPVRTFFNLPQNLGTLAHPLYAPADTVMCWRDEIAGSLRLVLSRCRNILIR
jgi:hypothetical protein